MQKFSQKSIGTSLVLLGVLAVGALVLGLRPTATNALAEVSQTTGPRTSQSSSPKKLKRPQQREAYRAELVHLLEENAVTCEKDDECDALGIGSMACGGPKEFLPVAKATLAKVQSSANDLTATIAELDQTKNKESGTMGICLALTKPKLICSAGKCEASK